MEIQFDVFLILTLKPVW